MEWRCEWCGKPHAENDPPCDNCGHGRFEKAVTRMGPDTTDAAGTPVWVCTECGRHHEKHSPPCSRCGNATLDRRQRDYGGVERVDSTGWLDILDRKYAAGYALVGVLALVLGLGLVGVVDLPVVGGGPGPPEVPGDAETVDGVSLTDTETELVDAVNDGREDAGTGPLDRGETLDAMATYYNARRVEHDYADGDEPTLSELDAFEPNCGGRTRISVLPYTRLYAGDVAGQDDATDAESLALGLVAGSGTGDSLVERLDEQERLSGVGVDIHAAPDRDLYVTVVTC